MVQGQNEGHIYEDKIGQELLEQKIVVKQVCPDCHKYEKFSSVQEKCPSCDIELKLTAGSGTQEDIIFKHNGKDFSLEVKNSARDPDWGQCALRPYPKGGKWIWDWTKKSKKTKSELIKIYDEFECIDGSKGLLVYLNKKNIIPNKHRVPNEEITFEMRKQDQRNFEDKEHRISSKAFGKFHKTKSQYVQIGKKHGFFHINNDNAGLGTKKFEAEFTLRFRAKHTQSHFPICPQCGKQRVPGSKAECKKCGINLKLDKDEGEKCQICLKDPRGNHDPIPYVKWIHRNDKIEFVLTILNPKIISKSKFNIEKEDGQEFPPIHS